MRGLLVFIPVVLLSFTLHGQTKTISGTVISADDNAPLPGVNVVVEGTSKGTVTAVDGTYSIELSPEETRLNFTFVGYVEQKITVTDQTAIDVVLQPDTQTLEEVVVIGYGVVKKSDLTGAVSSVRGSDLTSVPAVSPMQSLQGKVAGVQITSPSGAPGSTPVVRIRGTGTFNNSSPIYVVDGVILDNIDFLSSADIESMEVLKDASSTAIYGSRGANGVIMVTTKHGTAGTETVSINFSGEYGIQQLQKKIDLLSGREFAIIANEITPGSYNNVDAVPNTDWQDLLFEPAPMQNYNVSATGSSAKLQYYFGLGYFRQQGIIAKSDYERVSFKFNNTYNITDFLRFGSNISFTPNSQQNTNSNAPFTAYRAQPTIEPFLPDGSYSPVPGVGNFLADIEYTNNYDKAIRSVNNIFVEVDLFKDFTLRSSFGVDMAYRKNKSYTPQFFVSPQQQTSQDRLSKKKY
ncbi:MAG TPA: SusC/RagA family TonB-linked outer membrane protein [Chryseolinea sp.]